MESTSPLHYRFPIQKLFVLTAVHCLLHIDSGRGVEEVELMEWSLHSLHCARIPFGNMESVRQLYITTLQL